MMLVLLMEHHNSQAHVSNQWWMEGDAALEKDVKSGEEHNPVLMSCTCLVVKDAKTMSSRMRPSVGR